MPNDNRPAPAVLRNGDHAPALLLGAPVACPPAEGVAGAVILGWTSAGEPVLLTASSREWLIDLATAVADACQPVTAPAAVTP